MRTESEFLVDVLFRPNAAQVDYMLTGSVHQWLNPAYFVVLSAPLREICRRHLRLSARIRGFRPQTANR